MRDTRLQYLFIYAALGTVVPYASVFFRHAGLTEIQVGIAFAIWSLASVFSPAIVTMLADGRHDPRRLLAAASVISGTSLALMALSKGAGAIFGFWTLYCLASMPTFPLMDGIHFSQQRRRLDRGESSRPYHLVRVWGTIGYIVPNVTLYWFLRTGMIDLPGVLVSGGAIALLAAFQAFWLLDPRSPLRTPHAIEAGGQSSARAAAAALFSPQLIAFTAGVILMSMAATIHSAFYPVYLTERVGLADTWLGLTSTLATFFETFIIFGCGWMVAKVGVKRLLVLSMLGIALRMALIGSSTNIVIAVATQISHGLLVLAVGVLPQVIFDECAEDRYRHSMQGVLVMVTYAGRAAASLLGGKIAAQSLSATFYFTAGMCVAAALLVVFGFHESALKRAKRVDVKEAEDFAASTSIT